MATTASIFSTPPKGKKALNKMDSGFDVDEPHPLLRSAKEMIIAGFHTSAELMLSLLSATLDNDDELSKTELFHFAEIRMLLGDCYMESKEWKRAQVHYKAAFDEVVKLPYPNKYHNHLQKYQPQFAARGPIVSLPCILIPSLWAQIKADKTMRLDADIRERLGNVYLLLNNPRMAEKMLFGIPTELRSLKALRLLSKVYVEIGELNSAKGIHLSILCREPRAIESAEFLLKQGIKLNDLDVFYRKDELNQQDGNIEYMDDYESWIKKYLEAKAAEVEFKFTAAASAYKSLESKYRGNVSILLNIGDNCYKEGLTIDASYAYQRARQSDPEIVRSMDKYAALLKPEDRQLFANQLATSLLQMSTTRPEPWMTMARYAETKGDHERVLFFVNKALETDSKYAEAIYLKGVVLAIMGRHHDAIQCYRESIHIEPDAKAYHGLCECYILLQQFNEAITTAQDCYTKMPGSAKSACLMGTVLSNKDDETDQNRNWDGAISFFNRALLINPNNMEAVYGLAGIFGRQEKHEEALALLSSHLSQTGGDSTLHARIAEIHCMMGKFDQGIEHYNYALVLNPHNQSAREGLALAEKALNGDVEGDDGANTGNQVLAEGMSQGVDDDEDEDEDEEEEEMDDAEMSADI